MNVSIPRLCLTSLLVLLPAVLPAQSSDEFDEVAARYGRISTIAGSGLRDNCTDWTIAMEGGPATAADLSRPHNAAADSLGNVYIADKLGFAIRKVDLGGQIRTVAGTGTFGLPASTDQATQTDLWAPNGIFVFPDGTFYFLTVNDNCGAVAAGGKIHKVTPNGTISTVVEDATLFAGRGLHVLPDEETIYYCAGTGFRRWTSSGGITTIATGFSSLGNIDRERSGSFLVTDRDGSRAWRVQPDGGKVVVAGNGGAAGGGHGQLATSTGLDEVRGIAVVDTGGFFLCTHKGHQVWYVDTAGYIWRFIGNGNKGSVGDGFPAIDSRVQLSEPRNITIAPSGDLLITDNDDGFIRRVTNTGIAPRLVGLRQVPVLGFRLEWTSHREAQDEIRKSGDLENWETLPNTVAGSDSTTTHFTDLSADPAQSTYYQVREVSN